MALLFLTTGEPMAGKKIKRQWIVRVDCKITKNVVCEDCTEEEARTNPFDFAIEETEVSQEDWTVKSVESSN